MRASGTATTRVNFETVALKETFVWHENGKRRQKTETFEQTINPFNKTSKGKVKTRSEIMTELQRQRLHWLKKMRAEHPDTSE